MVWQLLRVLMWGEVFVGRQASRSTRKGMGKEVRPGFERPQNLGAQHINTCILAGVEVPELSTNKQHTLSVGGRARERIWHLRLRCRLRCHVLLVLPPPPPPLPFSPTEHFLVGQFSVQVACLPCNQTLSTEELWEAARDEMGVV